jgi:hypothetical protein
MRTKIFIAMVFAVALVMFALGGAWYLTHERRPEYCQLSGRMIQPHMLAVVRVKGKKFYTCCARCALTYQEQTGDHAEILEVTDFASGWLIDARKAWFVDGSRVEPCCPPAISREDGHTPYVRLFDRCSPSLVAFASQHQAKAFIEKNGGALTTLNEIESKLKSSGHGAKHD